MRAASLAAAAFGQKPEIIGAFKSPLASDRRMA
jgi:hypothetical protein